MKNAMKKIMGLLLVAVLLVSVVPFQASAATGSITIAVKNGDEVIQKPEAVEINNLPTTAATLLKYGKVSTTGDGDIVKVWSSAQQKDLGLDGQINDGDTITIQYSGKGEDPKPTEPAETKPAETTPTAKTIDVVVKIDNVVKNEFTWEPANGKSAVVSDLLTHGWMKGWEQTYEPVVSKDRTGAWSRANGSVQYTDSIAVGDTLTVNLTKIVEETTPAAEAIKVVVKVNTSDNVVKTFEKVPANGKSAKVGDLLTYGWSKDWDNVYEFDHAWNHTTQEEVTKSQSVKAGETLYIMLKNANGGSSSGNGSSSNKFPYKVYLHVYLNNNIGEPDRNINITNTLATDGVVSMSEVKNLIPTYYSAKNSDGIGYDGLYLAKGNWVKDYVTDSNKVDKLKDVDVRTGEEYVHINVMITNAKAKSSSTADSSNPKTGDAIFMTITVMGLSAAALTGMYFYDKKRKVL